MKKIVVLALFILGFSLQKSMAQPPDSLRLLNLKAPEIFCAKMETNLGAMIIEVNRSWSQLAADRFYQLVASGFYNDTRLFRSNLKYLQFGITNDSTINAFWSRHQLKDEKLIQKNTAGTISFAKSGPNSRTHSVYFNKIDNPKLDTLQRGLDFPAFGKIIEGSTLLAKFENKYPDSVVFKHWDAMTNKGNSYTDKVLPGVNKIVSMDICQCKTPFRKLSRKKIKAD